MGLSTADRLGARPLLVGGAGLLESPHEAGRAVIDDPAFVPPEWRGVAASRVSQLETCLARPHLDWVFHSPPVILEPDTRTGFHRRGTTTLLVNDCGTSAISVEDLAVAVIDEFESPGAERRITVAH